MSDKKFINGLLVKAPGDRAPEYVKARLSIRREELIAWLQSEDGDWINADIKVSTGGKWYAAVDDWKPQGGGRGSSGGAPQRHRPATAPQRAHQAAGFNDDFADDDIPFISAHGPF